MNKRLTGMAMMAAISAAMVMSASADDVIKLGVAAPFTGDSSIYGDYAKKGAELAVEELNAAGGVLGMQVELEYGDDKGDSTEAVSVAQKFATDESLTGIIGHVFSGCTLAAGEVYQANEIPTVAWASTNPDVLNIGDYVYRVSIGDNYQGGALAELLAEKGFTSAAVVYESTDYGTGVADAFKEKFEAAGGAIALDESYTTGSNDYSLILTEVMTSDAQVLIIAGYDADAAKIMMQAQGLAMSLPVYCSDGVYTDTLIELGGAAVEGVNVVCYFSTEDTNEVVQNYLAKLTEKGEEVDSWSAYCYDAVMLMADAIERAGSTDRTAIKDAIAATRDFSGVCGTISFENSNEPASKDVVVVTVKDGAYTVAE